MKLGKGVNEHMYLNSCLSQFVKLSLFVDGRPLVNQHC